MGEAQAVKARLRQLRERRLLEESLQMARQNEDAKQAFFRSMSHDMRTPLNAILGSLQLARQHLGDPQRAGGYLARMESSARYLLEHRREGKTVRLTGQNGVRYTVPQYLDPAAMEETVTVRFRVGRPYRDADLAVYLDGRLLRRVHKRILSPGEMEQLTLRRADLPRGLKQITIQVEEGAQ